jgi:hypothetical protein
MGAGAAAPVREDAEAAAAAPAMVGAVVVEWVEKVSIIFFF